ASNGDEAEIGGRRTLAISGANGSLDSNRGRRAGIVHPGKINFVAGGSCIPSQAGRGRISIGGKADWTSIGGGPHGIAGSHLVVIRCPSSKTGVGIARGSARERGDSCEVQAVRGAGDCY